MDDGRTEKVVNYDFEPFRPMNQTLYNCGPWFDTSPLASLMGDDKRFGFVIVDGNGALFAILQGNNTEILQKISVDLPKKHRKGGQSSVRFARLREESRHNYIRKVAELTNKYFIKDDKPNIAGIVFAGNADFKTVLSETDLLDKRLKPAILAVLDVSYGGENGLNEAITLAAESLTNVKFVAEKKLISKFFGELAQDTGMIAFGIDDTLKAMDAGALDTLMLFEELEVNRYELKDPLTGEVRVLVLNADQEKSREFLKNPKTGKDYDIIDQ